MWGSDYPHDEGTYPYTRENLRARFHDAPEAELRQILAGNAAELYDFDLDALAPLAAQVGPTVAEVAQPIDAMPDKRLDRISSATWTRGRSSERRRSADGARRVPSARVDRHVPTPRASRSSSSTTRRPASAASR